MSKESWRADWEYTEERTGHVFWHYNGYGEGECAKCGEVYTYRECQRGSIRDCEVE